VGRGGGALTIEDPTRRRPRKQLRCNPIESGLAALRETGTPGLRGRCRGPISGDVRWLQSITISQPEIEPSRPTTIWSPQPHPDHQEGPVAEAEVTAAEMSSDDQPLGTPGQRFDRRSPFFVGLAAGPPASRSPTA